jgi:hypothetical protein
VPGPGPAGAVRSLGLSLLLSSKVIASASCESDSDLTAAGRARRRLPGPVSACHCALAAALWHRDAAEPARAARRRVHSRPQPVVARWRGHCRHWQPRGPGALAVLTLASSAT